MEMNRVLLKLSGEALAGEKKQRLISVLIRNRLRHLMRQRSQRAIRG